MRGCDNGEYDDDDDNHDETHQDSKSAEDLLVSPINSQLIVERVGSGP